MKYRNLTENDTSLLKSWGYTEIDFSQINAAFGKTTYELIGKKGKSTKISAKKAKEILGTETFLSGLSRSAFHFASSRTSENGEQIIFDSNALFI